MREPVHSGLGSRWAPTRRWCRAELRVAPLELVLALRRPTVQRLATVIRTAATSPPATVTVPLPLVRELRLERAEERANVERGPRETRIETMERTVIAQRSRYERIEAIAPAGAAPAAPVPDAGARQGAVAPSPPAPMLVPVPAVVLARAPAAPAPSVPATTTTPGERHPSGAPGPAGPVGAAAVAPAAPDIEAIATQVLRRIERRAIAQRERMGRG